jgi:hypothetical protein
MVKYAMVGGKYSERLIASQLSLNISTKQGNFLSAYPKPVNYHFYMLNCVVGTIKM